MSEGREARQATRGAIRCRRESTAGSQRSSTAPRSYFRQRKVPRSQGERARPPEPERVPLEQPSRVGRVVLPARPPVRRVVRLPAAVVAVRPAVLVVLQASPVLSVRRAPSSIRIRSQPESLPRWRAGRAEPTQELHTAGAAEEEAHANPAAPKTTSRSETRPHRAGLAHPEGTVELGTRLVSAGKAKTAAMAHRAQAVAVAALERVVAAAVLVSQVDPVEPVATARTVVPDLS